MDKIAGIGKVVDEGELVGKTPSTASARHAVVRAGAGP